MMVSESYDLSNHKEAMSRVQQDPSGPDMSREQMVESDCIFVQSDQTVSCEPDIAYRSARSMCTLSAN